MQHVATKVVLTGGAKHQVSQRKTVSFLAYGQTTIFVPDQGQAIKPQKVTVTLHTQTDDTVKNNDDSASNNCDSQTKEPS